MNAKLFSFKVLALIFVSSMLLLSNGFAQNNSKLSACEEQQIAKATEKGKANDGKKAEEKEKPEPALTITLTNVADPEKNLVQSSKVEIKETNFTSKKEVEIANAETPYYWPAEKAVYIDGNQELFISVGQKAKYPNELRKDKVQGIVVVQVIVEKDGSITNPQVVAQVHPKLDEAALQVISELKCFIPAKQNNQPVRSYFNIPVPFLFEVKK